MVVAYFLAKFPDVHINRTVADDDIVTPNGFVDFITEKDLIRLGDKQGKELKFLSGQHHLCVIDFQGEFFLVNDQVANMQDFFLVCTAGCHAAASF